MIKLTERQVADYFQRSYTAVDGLWFIKVEEHFGFNSALEVDEDVWKVLPKIQARMIKSITGLDNGIQDLCEAITTRLALENFGFEIECEPESFRIIVTECPWHELMIKSGRDHLSGRVGNLICQVENSVWAEEFEVHGFWRDEQICLGSKRCVLRFRELDPALA